MSLAAAAALQLRLEQQRHWQLAAAVRDGRQPSIDPDSDSLVEIRRNERIYSAASGPFSKQMVSGAWELTEVY